MKDTVTIQEAVTVFLRICGYELLAEAQGGFPVGYSKVASDTKLLKNVSVKNSEVSRKDMAILLENAFNLGMYEIGNSSSGEGMGYSVSDDTILSEYWDMYYTEGVVTAANGTNLYAGTETKNVVTIGDISYSADKNEDYIDYLGTYSKAYYTEIDDIKYIERGYEDIVGKLASVGADIRRVFIEEIETVEKAN